MFPFDKIYDELKAVPITMILLTLLYISVAWLYEDHVSARDFTMLRSQIVGVESTLRRDHIDTRIHSVETELFNLKQHVADEQSHGKASDALYYQRIDDLNNQLAALREESARLGGP